MQHLVDHNALDVRIGGAEAFLDDVGAELLFGQSWDVPFETMAQWVRKGGLGEIEDVLYHIVPERILDQGVSIRSDLANKMSLLIAGCMINAAL